jgi:hypothetical protein
MKYRKKPVVIEAVQWTGDNEKEIRDLDGERFPRVLFDQNRIYIETLEGPMTANLGDYIIKGVRGELYSCRSDIFEETYENA